MSDGLLLVGALCVYVVDGYMIVNGEITTRPDDDDDDDDEVSSLAVPLFVFKLGQVFETEMSDQKKYKKLQYYKWYHHSTSLAVVLVVEVRSRFWEDLLAIHKRRYLLRPVRREWSRQRWVIILRCAGGSGTVCC